MVDFKGLETAVWIARLASFKAAAARLNATQPALSVRIAQLESELGAQLFDRANRAVVATPAGRRVLEYAERLLQLRSELIASVADRSLAQGTFRLGVAETIVHTWLPRFLEQMSAEYPKLELEIEVDISTHLRERLLVQEIDLAFMVGPISEPAIVNTPLCDYPMAFVASPSLGLHKGETALDTIAQRPILTFARDTQPYVGVSELFADPRHSRPRIYASSSLATLVRMALDGIGVAAIPPVIVESEIKSRQLAIVGTPVGLSDLHFIAGWLSTHDRRRVEDIVAIARKVAEASENAGKRAKPPRDKARRGPDKR